MVEARLQVGVAEGRICAGEGPALAGDWVQRVAAGSLTALQAKALYLSGRGKSLLILCLDLRGLCPGDARLLTSRVAGRCGLEPAAVLTVCSHAPDTPRTVPLIGAQGIEEAFIQRLIRDVPEIAAEAQANLREGSLGIGTARLPHLLYNHRLQTRNYHTISAWMGVPPDEVLCPEGPTDPLFRVVVIRGTEGHPLCLLWNFAADLRFPEGEGNLLSAGLPFLVQQEIDRRLGRHLPCLYLPGCGANVSYAFGLQSTVDRVASAVMAVQLETSCDPEVVLDWASERMVLPVRNPEAFWIRPDIELKCPQALSAFEEDWRLLKAEGNQAVEAAIQVLRLGRCALVGLPGMPFVELALAIRKPSPFEKTLVAANSGGYVGYVATRRAFARRGFETWPSRASPVGPGGGEFMTEEALGLLKALKG